MTWSLSCPMSQEMSRQRLLPHPLPARRRQCWGWGPEGDPHHQEPLDAARGGTSQLRRGLTLEPAQVLFPLSFSLPVEKPSTNSLLTCRKKCKYVTDLIS